LSEQGQMRALQMCDKGAGSREVTPHLL